MAENLRQSHKIIAGVCEELMRHRVPQQVRVDLDAGDGAVLVAQRPNAPIRQRPSLADEDQARLKRRASVDVCLERTPS
jgi:hypothetical protein